MLVTRGMTGDRMLDYSIGLLIHQAHGGLLLQLIRGPPIRRSELSDNVGDRYLDFVPTYFNYMSVTTELGLHDDDDESWSLSAVAGALAVRGNLTGFRCCRRGGLRSSLYAPPSPTLFSCVSY